MEESLQIVDEVAKNGLEIYDRREVKVNCYVPSAACSKDINHNEIYVKYSVSLKH